MNDLYCVDEEVVSSSLGLASLFSASSIGFSSVGSEEVDSRTSLGYRSRS